MNTIPINMLRQIFDCDPTTGVVYWKIPRRGVVAGDTAGHLCKSTGYEKITFGRRGFRTHRVIWALVHGVWPEVEERVMEDIVDRLRVLNFIVSTVSKAS